MAAKIANRYTLQDLIGQGGMADVYRAYDEVLNREVAVKILRPSLASDAQTLMRFLREASAARKLHHPNVVDIYDVGESNGLHYIVMEYVEGQTLKELIADTGPMDVREAISIMKQMTSAVAQAHAEKIIHRDIKPQNVLVAKDGRLKITDFGIAVAADNLSLTRTNAVMGSAHYLAPESAAGMVPDYRVDIYSLGIVFFELLAGNVPYSGTSPAAIALKHMQDALPSITPYNPDVPQSVVNIVIKATAKNPDERYQSAGELLDALEHAMDPDKRNEAPLVLETKSLKIPSAREIAREPEVKTPKLRELPKATVSKVGFGTRLTIVLASVGLVILIGAAVISSGILPVSGLFGWQQIPVVTNLTQQEALDELAEKGFTNVVVEPVISDSVDAGYAIQTRRDAGTLVKTDSEIVLQVSKGPSFLVSDYTGQYLDDVKESLEEQGVTLTYEITEEGAPDTNPGIILAQSGLNPGDRIDPSEGLTIKFTVSAYPSITIPASIIGMDIQEAKMWLNEQGIAAIAVNYYGGTTVAAVDPGVGSTYTQEGSDSVVTLYY